MFKKQLLVLLGFSLIINACSMFGKKNNIEKDNDSLILSDSLGLDMMVDIPSDSALIDTNFESFIDTNSQSLR